MSPLIKHPKRRGEWVEMQFMARAAAHNLVVSKPWGDSARYDFITEYRGFVARVQVKSTSYAQKGGHYLCNTVSRGPYSPDRKYTRQEIDAYAFFVIPEDLWYIVPFAAAEQVHYAVYLDPHEPRNRYFPFLEAWRLLKLSPRAAYNSVARKGRS